MSRRRICFEGTSELVRLFVARSPAGTQDPAEIVCLHVRRLRADALLAGPKPALEPVLRLRNINGPEVDDTLSGDGCLVPSGKTYADGFQVLLRGGVSATRTRF